MDSHAKAYEELPQKPHGSRIINHIGGSVIGHDIPSTLTTVIDTVTAFEHVVEEATEIVQEVEAAVKTVVETTEKVVEEVEEVVEEVVDEVNKLRGEDDEVQVPEKPVKKNTSK
jgi:hypothetical protein